MRLVIIADDARVGIDALNYDGLDMSQLDPSIHAVQWYGEYGEVEYKSVFADGQITKPQNKVITDITPYQWAVDVWNSAKLAEEAAIAAAEAAQAEAAPNQPVVNGADAL
jgi:hypothetical protein